MSSTALRAVRDAAAPRVFPRADRRRAARVPAHLAVFLAVGVTRAGPAARPEQLRGLARVTAAMRDAALSGDLARAAGFADALATGAGGQPDIDRAADVYRSTAAALTPHAPITLESLRGRAAERARQDAAAAAFAADLVGLLAGFPDDDTLDAVRDRDHAVAALLDLRAHRPPVAPSTGPGTRGTDPPPRPHLLDVGTLTAAPHGPTPAACPRTAA